jgi:hypothetical protein
VCSRVSCGIVKECWPSTQEGKVLAGSFSQGLGLQEILCLGLYASPSTVSLNRRGWEEVTLPSLRQYWGQGALLFPLTEKSSLYFNVATIKIGNSLFQWLQIQMHPGKL